MHLLRRVRARTAPAAASAPDAAPGPEALAEARDVSVRLGARTVVHGANLTVRPGEVLALVGPNGAGKSTLLAALAGDLPLIAGELRVADRPLSSWTPRELATLRAVLPQSTTLAFPFTVEEVVRMGRTPWAGTPAEDGDEAAVADALRATEADGFAARPFSALSGGERARVALARVLAQRTPLLLLDEPTAALDLRHQELVLRLCRDRAASGAGVAVVLHDLGLAAAYADRVAVLHEGRVAACGPPAEVLEAELLTRVYRQPVEIVPHPRTGEPLVLPRRDTLGSGSTSP
ncbi:heme ABC transporter ATP-binding protein [Streptomyces boncukensis]|uniref:Heme ABC transporter ATP-binding protein n=1 Tax=Streptomyces boncukensis TaxID=2711219 RepID=A0A6G4X0P5_9ACTN|nr:heme ABC transporter ATP-binding protein [Streptomyces boncukensis]NGO70460.1 heme ABC transporter ATP-binding protein [Streptomyces boncukensis]